MCARNEGARVRRPPLLRYGVVRRAFLAMTAAVPRFGSFPFFAVGKTRARARAHTNPVVASRSFHVVSDTALIDFFRFRFLRAKRVFRFHHAPRRHNNFFSTGRREDFPSFLRAAIHPRSDYVDGFDPRPTASIPAQVHVKYA